MTDDGRADTHLDGLLLGVATASTQIEGGDVASCWIDWAARPGTIRDGSSPVRATDHWRRWREDTGLMASLGVQAYWSEVEWARRGAAHSPAQALLPLLRPQHTRIPTARTGCRRGAQSVCGCVAGSGQREGQFVQFADRDGNPLMVCQRAA